MKLVCKKKKSGSPSDPVEQTTRAAAPAPPSHWRDRAARRRASERGELSPRDRARRACCSRRMRGVPIVDSFQGQEQVTFCGVIVTL
ncbi:unnamed protein product [Euphydryas editha]|uniref:Uncharacterized protein n=1 Tax=Euphydryas editha TaxID=104508 RepID=A0AAU9THN8_EUPED|nr:unnamed protein product [Euphydryas editha]